MSSSKRWALASLVLGVLALPSTALAIDVECTDANGTCSVSNEPADSFSCTCDNGSADGGGGTEDWLDLSERELLMVCEDLLVTECGEAPATSGSGMTTGMGGEDGSMTTGVGDSTDGGDTGGGATTGPADGSGDSAPADDDGTPPPAGDDDGAAVNTTGATSGGDTGGDDAGASEDDSGCAIASTRGSAHGLGLGLGLLGLGLLGRRRRRDV